jgi:hypothetical protein
MKQSRSEVKKKKTKPGETRKESHVTWLTKSAPVPSKIGTRRTTEARSRVELGPSAAERPDGVPGVVGLCAFLLKKTRTTKSVCWIRGIARVEG